MPKTIKGHCYSCRKTQTIHCRHHIQKLGKHISFRKWFQPECKCKKSVRAFTAVRGGPFVEELTLEISNKLLSSEIRERDSWLSKLSLDFLEVHMTRNFLLAYSKELSK